MGSVIAWAPQKLMLCKQMSPGFSSLQQADLQQHKHKALERYKLWKYYQSIANHFALAPILQLVGALRRAWFESTLRFLELYSPMHVGAYLQHGQNAGGLPMS